VETKFDEMMAEVMAAAMERGDNSIVRLLTDLTVNIDGKYDKSKGVQSEITSNARSELVRIQAGYLQQPLQYTARLEEALVNFSNEANRLNDFEKYEQAHANKQTESEQSM